MDLRIEMITSSPESVSHGNIPIERPEGFDDELYRQHALCAAQLLKSVMSGDVDYRHVASDGETTTMLVVDENTPQDVIDRAFQIERNRQYDTCEWSRPHLIEVPITIS